MAATRKAPRWKIARLFGKGIRGKKGFGGFGGDLMPFSGSRTFMVAPGSPVWMDRDYSRFALEAYMRNVVAHRCIAMVAQGAACVQLRLFAVNRRGIRKELKQHPILDLLNQPNPAMAHAAFMEAIYQYRMISGNSFIQALGAAGTQPQELHVLRPDRVAIIAGQAGQPAAYRYTVNGNFQDFPIDSVTWESQVLHLKTFHPLNDWYGLSPVEAVAYSIDQHNQAGAWNQALLQNGARPSGALVVKGTDGQGGTLSEDQYYRLKAQIDEQFAGPINAGRPMLLEGGLDWKELSLSPKDMDFIQSKNTSARDIALGFGVPPQMLGIPGDNTYSNLQEARLALWEQTILPIMRATIHSMSQWLSPMFGGGLEICPDLGKIEALAGRNQVVWDRVEKANFLTDDEKRAAVGYPPLPPGVILSATKFGREKYSPDQPRDYHGRWTSGGDVTGATDAESALHGTGNNNDSTNSAGSYQEAMGAIPPAAEMTAEELVALQAAAEAQGTAEGAATTAAETVPTLTKPEGIPDDWTEGPTGRGGDGGGVRYADPLNPQNDVRIMPGNSDSIYPNSQSPYVRWNLNGQPLDVNGNPVSVQSDDAHIPLTDFKFNPKVFK